MKRLVTLLLAVIMLVTCVPSYAMATGTETLDESELSAIVAEETTEPVVEETTEPVAETIEPVVEETTEPVVEETTEPVVEETTEPVVEETTEPVAEESTAPQIVVKEQTISYEAADASASILASGTCGKALTWKLDNNGTLTISGTGEMTEWSEWSEDTKLAWNDYLRKIKSIVIERGVTSIGYGSFKGCINLESVSLPDTLVKISSHAFANCEMLKTVVLPDSVTALFNDAFNGCISLTSVTLPKNLSNISSMVFKNCTSLASIDIPDSVTTIGSWAFSNCTALKSVEIPDGVSDITYAFSGCSGLTSVKLPKAILEIGNGAFTNCKSLESIDLPDTVELIGDEVFSGCSKLKAITLPESVCYIGGGAFIGCSALTSIDIPKNVTRIRGSTFASSGLTQITIPDSVTNIGSSAFYNCSSLTSITIPESVTEIGANAFASCRSLTSITIPDGVTSIDDYAFAWCNSLATITIPDSTTTIGSSAFSGCDSLKTVYYTGTKQQKNAIEINVDNDSLTSATWHCNYEPLAITKQPKSVCVKAGETAKVTVKATGEGLTYKWYYKKPGASKFYASSTFTKGTYYVKDMDASKSGWKVYCKITDSYGNSVKTNTVTLNIPATITKQPVSVGVANGSAAKVSVKAVGKGLTYTWYYKKPGAKNFYKSTTKKSTYSLTMSNSNDGRQVYCVVTDSYGNQAISKTVTLNKAVTITTQPKDKTVNEGETAKITVKATGTGLTYKWYYKKPGAKKFYASSSFTKGTYYVKNMDATKSGWQAYCVITDAYGNKVTTKTVTLSVNKIYLNRYGSKYHYDQECAGKTAYESTLSQALEKGKTPCSTCVH